MSYFDREKNDQLATLWRKYLGGELAGTGTPGEPGATGPAGPKGDTGPAGEDGRSAGIVVYNDGELVSALAKVHASPNGGSIEMRAGDYFTNIFIDNDNVRISADPGAILYPPDRTSGVILNKVSNCKVEGLTVKNPTFAGTGEVFGIAIYGGSYNQVSRCAVYNSDDAGISVRYDLYGYYNRSAADRKDEDLNYDTDGHHHIITDNVVIGTTEGSGIELIRCNDVVCCNNIVDGASQHGIRMTGTHGCVVDGNRIDNAAQDSISVQGFGDSTDGITKYSRRNLISNNKAAGLRPLWLYNGAEDLLIAGNSLIGTASTSNIIRFLWVAGHVSPYTYDVKNVAIVGNLLKGGVNAIYGENDIDGLFVDDNMFIDFETSAINMSSTTYGNTIDSVSARGNVMRPINDATTSTKYGVLGAGANTTIKYGGNCHFPYSGYTYIEEAEFAEATLIYCDDSPNPTGEPTGFADPEAIGATLSFVNGTRTFSITPTGASFEFYVKGRRYVKYSADSVVITDVEGDHFIYYDEDGVLQHTTTFDPALIEDYAYVAYLRWDATNSELILLGKETHGLMPHSVHRYLHVTRGTAVESGLGLGDIEDGASGSLDSSAEISTASGHFWDEDIRFTITGEASPAQIPVFYRSGASGDWRRGAVTDAPVLTTGTGRAAWNEWTGATWQLTEVGNLQFVNMHIFATNDLDQPYIAVMGQATYTTQNQARAGAQVEVGSLLLDGLPVVEFVLVGTVIYQTSNSYANTWKSRTVWADTSESYVSWVNVPLSPGSAAGDHKNLLNIGTYDHDYIDNRMDMMPVSKTYADSPYTVGTEERYIIVDATTAATTIRIPDAATAKGSYTVKKIDAAFPVAVWPLGGNIDGAATLTLTTQYQSVTVISDGTDWWTI